MRITTALRERVAEATAVVRAMIDAGVVPPAVNDARCKNCSLIEICQPALRDTGPASPERARLFDVDA